VASTTKCAVVGTYCSGKTTLVNALLAAGRASHLLNENPRRIIALTGNGAMRVPAVRDYLIVATLLEEAEVARRAGLFIADGGLVNNIAHDSILLDAPPSRKPLLELFKFRPYDCVFWCDPSSIEIEDDGARFTEPHLRTRLHEAVGRVLKEMGIQYHFVTGSPNERLEFALDKLGQIRFEK
jgi:nicotinamide riboside kinase